MSLILEALKKSEAERRAGEVPVLLGDRAFVPRRERPVWPVFAVFVICVGLAAAYVNRSILWPGQFPPKPEAEAAATVASMPEGSMPIPAGDPPATARKPAALTGEPVPDPATAAAASVPAAEPTPEELPEPPATFRPPPASMAPAAEPAAPVAPPPAPVAAAAPPDAADPPPTYGTPPLGQDPPLVDTAMPESAPPTAAPDPLPVPAIAAGTGDATQAPAEAPAPARDLPLLGDLAFATRQAMPALKVSMQVYHQDPGRRFIIVNGARLQEGGVVGTETWLREIRPDGVVFEFRGERFLLPRQGG